ncbi:cupin-like domain-containing protein [Polyangium fumosum]|nr:cupin-like domain-containing protein [Polyangium fumosum]
MNSLFASDAGFSHEPPPAQPLERLSASEAAARLARPEGRERPFIISGMTRSWPACRRWSPTFFKERYGDRSIVVERWRSGVATTDPMAFLRNRYYSRESLRAVIEHMEAGLEAPGSCYITYANIFEDAQELNADIEPLHEQLGVPNHYPAQLRRWLCLRPGFWLGPAGTVSTVHYDRHENFNVQVYGRKRWTLFAPGDAAALYANSAELPVVLFSPVDVERPDYGRYPSFRQARPLQGDLDPGDVIFVPCSWWHHVRALEMSITLNYWWWSARAAWAAARVGYLQARRHVGLRIASGGESEDAASMPTE